MEQSIGEKIRDWFKKKKKKTKKETKEVGGEFARGVDAISKIRSRAQLPKDY